MTYPENKVMAKPCEDCRDIPDVPEGQAAKLAALCDCQTDGQSS